jgi:hypothetical protein
MRNGYRRVEDSEHVGGRATSSAKTPAPVQNDERVAPPLVWIPRVALRDVCTNDQRPVELASDGDANAGAERAARVSRENAARSLRHAVVCAALQDYSSFHCEPKA